MMQVRFWERRQVWTSSNIHRLDFSLLQSPTGSRQSHSSMASVTTEPPWRQITSKTNCATSEKLEASSSSKLEGFCSTAGSWKYRRKLEARIWESWAALEIKTGTLQLGDDHVHQRPPLFEQMNQRGRKTSQKHINTLQPSDKEAAFEEANKTGVQSGFAATSSGCLVANYYYYYYY